MPSFDNIYPVLLYMVLPALLASAIMAAIERFGGAKQAAAGAALGLMIGAVAGLCLRDTMPLLLNGKSDDALRILPHIFNFIPGPHTWNRLPWLVLAALCLGRVAYLADVHSDDGWLLRGGVAIAISWAFIPDDKRDATMWIAPAFAAVLWAEWVIADRLAALPGSSSVAACLAMSLLAGGGVLVYASTAKLMDAQVVVAFALIGVWLVSYWRGVEIGGAVPGVVVALPGVLLMGYYNSSAEVLEVVHWSAFALPACAPLLLAVTLPITHWRKPWLHSLRLALVLIPLVIAVVLAMEAGSLDTGAGDDEW